MINETIEINESEKVFFKLNYTMLQYTTCTFCYNLVYAKSKPLAQTPVCSDECRKKLRYKPNEKSNDNVTEWKL